MSLMRHELRVRRRTILWWTVGLAFFAALYMAYYPALPDSLLEIDLESIDVYRSMGVRSMATFEGYMQSTVFNFLPLLVGAFGLVLGAGALAGDEDAGTLEILAALPLSRLRLYAAKASAILLSAFLVLLGVALIVGVTFLAIESEVDSPITVSDVFWAVLANWLIAYVFLALGLCLGAFAPSRGSALALGSAILVLTFFGNNLAGMVTALDDVKPLFPFSYFSRVSELLTGDVPWDDVGALVAMGTVLLLVGALGFQRRDLTVGAWPWQGLSAGRTAGTGSAASRSRRVVASVAAVALLACGCVAVAVAAVAVSDDLRADVRDAIGLDEVVTLEGELEAGLVPAVAASEGRVQEVLVEVGADVEDGAALVLLAASDASEVRLEAQLLLEDAWTLLEELSAGEVAATRAELETAIEEARAQAADATRSWQDARAIGEGQARLDELGARSRLAEDAVRLAEARLALAEGRLEGADVAAVEEALASAQDRLGGDGGPVPLQSVRAPVAGRLDELLVAATETVTAGQTVARIAASEALHLVDTVSEEDAERIAPGMEVDVDVDGFDDPFSGAVLEVIRRDADDRYHVRVAVADPTGELEPGRAAEARLELD